MDEAREILESEAAAPDVGLPPPNNGKKRRWLTIVSAALVFAVLVGLLLKLVLVPQWRHDSAAKAYDQNWIKSVT